MLIDNNSFNTATAARMQTMANEPQVVEHFFGVYLLYCKNPKYKGRTYIGYTVDPRRRINQHNAGQKFGGAWRTSNRGPWEMVLIIHGFPNSTSALRVIYLIYQLITTYTLAFYFLFVVLFIVRHHQFEWAWQHPQLSRRLKHVGKKRARQKTFDYLLEVCSAMLNCGPWNKLPLTVRWLDDEFGQKYSTHLTSPLHMPITYGKVTSRKKKTTTTTTTSNDKAKEAVLAVLGTRDDGSSRDCIKPDCGLVAHLVCLAKLFCKESGDILPVEGSCPICATDALWGDLIRKKIGCNLHIDADVDESGSSSSSEEDDDYQSDD
ncbi:unnamed protein product [Trichogramma brassicae]|uniref:Structure-specific endonuclease subunit SLX1 homolog n=1 Tax=Trichogramma brassicae TaxID=86971 RepID=A0A6H5IW07_9HYME|nr:unnamed protein product [Trichogramma brassicae]